MITEVVAALIWDNNKFLICQRPANKERPLLWEFVGGKVEPCETPKMLEHNDIRWISVEEIPDFEFCPADEEILIRLQSIK